MKTLITGLALGLAVVVGAGTASANTCPLLIKQLREQLPNVKDKAKHDQAAKLTDECEKLHNNGKHADSVKTCEEAAKVAGIKLQMKQ